MDITDNLIDYAINHSSNEPNALKKIRRYTKLFTNGHRMMSSPYQGRILSLISNLIQPAKILEIGTFTGYSAFCLAEGLQTNGILHTIDINETHKHFLTRLIAKEKFENHVILRFGDAIDLIPLIKEKFDLVFIDANKRKYSHYYDLVFDKLKPNGTMIVDNVLWKGKVLSDNIDKITLAIKEFNTKIANDERVQVVLLPIRDGLSIIRKIK